ncbi:hypothetical protein E4T50_12349 [Aureobasidium sp. EXF-12298]|nr:hypothetical protein E4T50_12349 [Aureobasidium sp. EXF-12298]KAI4762931.1 hypothetical protein E4T51_04040 [Aureobasidium sp. EXF-12344]KAI4770616.1 hypothetical protein E4T52_14381 [Aureobasidium sp. EXF-3400]
MAGPSRPGAAHGGHPIHIHPVRPLYRFAATGLGASMWFFVSCSSSDIHATSLTPSAVDVQSQKESRVLTTYKDGPALLGWKHPWDH